jgi:hypothetical protein
MWTYTSNDLTIVTDGRGAFVPCDTGNADYRAIIESGVEIAPYVPPPEPVPDSVTARQIRIFLYREGLLQSVEQMVNAADGATRIEWEYGTEYHRQSPVLLGFAQAMGLTSAQLDDWFKAASKI